MISDFDRFCVTHACAPWCLGQKNYCPLAHFSNLTYGDIDGRRCERGYNDLRRYHKKNHYDTAEQSRA